MGSIRKKGAGYEASVCIQGKRKSKSFRLKSQASAWINDVEVNGFSANMTVKRLMETYLENIAETHKGYRWERVRIEKLSRMPVAAVRLDRLASKDVSAWRDARLSEVKESSVNREWNLLSSIFTYGMELNLLNKHPMKGVKRPQAGKSRNRTFSQEEIDKLCEVMASNVKDAFLLALETGLRISEICNIQEEDIFPRHVHIREPKNGHARDVPLSKAARDLVRVFDITPGSLSTLFRNARIKAGIEGVTFHDTRHTALTKLSKIYTNPMELAKISGHRDLKTLLNVYYNPTIDDLADKLD